MSDYVRHLLASAGIEASEQDIETIASDPHPTVLCQLLIDWRTTREEQALQELAVAYHRCCESYDRTVCSGRSPRTDEAMPIDGCELALVNKNARRVREDIMMQGECIGLTRDKIEKAIRDARDRH